MIPKIIHQTWKNNIIPDNWVNAVESCKSKHVDYQYIIWTDETMDDFVRSSFPDFYQTYISYKYNIQRCDAFRYLVLYVYGGIYLDMDIICKKRLDSLLIYDIVFAKSSNILSSLTNSFFMAIPQHPFIKFAINNLPLNINKFNFLGKHIHVMNSTGPSYLNHIYKIYPHKINNYYFLTNTEFAGDCNVCNENSCRGGTYFKHIKGQSWNSIDSLIYKFILCQYKKIIVIIILIILTIFYYKYSYKN